MQNRRSQGLLGMSMEGPRTLRTALVKGTLHVGDSEPDQTLPALIVGQRVTYVSQSVANEHLTISPDRNPFPRVFAEQVVPDLKQMGKIVIVLTCPLTSFVARLVDRLMNS